MISTLIYIHGQYGSPEEAEREFAEYFDGLAERVGGSIGIIANSIGAFYAMCALAGRNIAAAYFISPIVDLERIESVTLDDEHLRYVRQHPIEASTGSIPRSRWRSWMGGFKELFQKTFRNEFTLVRWICR